MRIVEEARSRVAAKNARPQRGRGGLFPGRSICRISCTVKAGTNGLLVWWGILSVCWISLTGTMPRARFSLSAGWLNDFLTWCAKCSLAAMSLPAIATGIGRSTASRRMSSVRTRGKPNTRSKTQQAFGNWLSRAELVHYQILPLGARHSGRRGIYLRFQHLSHSSRSLWSARGAKVSVHACMRQRINASGVSSGDSPLSWHKLSRSRRRISADFPIGFYRACVSYI